MTTLPARAVSTDEWVDRAKSIGPVVEKYRGDSEQQRHMARPIFDAIREIGIIGMCAPRAFGGPQADPLANLRVIEEISRQDGSAGWNAMIWTGTGVFADYLAEDVARDIIGDGSEAIVGGAINPTAGKARPVDGGFDVSGRWSFGSGYHYLTWLIVACMVMDGDQPHMLPNGMPEIIAAFVPQSDSEVLDTWYTAGMRGTGSHDFVIDKVSVPAERTFPLGTAFASAPPRPSRAYRTPFYDNAGAQIASVGLGIARDAIDTFKGMAGSKTPTVGTVTLANLHTIQDRVARAEALLRSARMYLFGTVEDVATGRYGADTVSEEGSAALRLASAHAAQSSVDAVDLMFDGGGGTAIYATNRLERCFRDVHMVTHHVCVAPSNLEMVGQYLLGGPLQIRR